MAEDIGGQIYPSYTANVNPQVVAEIPTPARPTGPLPTSLPTSVYSRPTMSEDSLNVNLNTTDIEQLKRAAGIIAILKSVGVKPNVASDAFKKIIPQSLQGFLDMGPSPDQLTNLIAQARTGGNLDPQAMRGMPLDEQMSISSMWQGAQQQREMQQYRQQQRKQRQEQLAGKRAPALTIPGLAARKAIAQALSSVLGTPEWTKATSEGKRSMLLQSLKAQGVGLQKGIDPLSMVQSGWMGDYINETNLPIVPLPKQTIAREEEEEGAPGSTLGDRIKALLGR